MRTTAGNPGRCRTRRQTPAIPASHTPTAPSFSVFSATATTDQGRGRSLDRPHPDADGSDSPYAGHARGTEGRNRAASRRPGIAVQVRCGAICRRRPSRKQQRALAGQPDDRAHCGRVRDSFLAVTRDPARRALGGRRSRASRRPQGRPPPRVVRQFSAPVPHVARDGESRIRCARVRAVKWCPGSACVRRGPRGPPTVRTRPLRKPGLVTG
jgi:hypothetical protein